MATKKTISKAAAEADKTLAEARLANAQASQAEAEARKAEKTAHVKMDKMFGKRANVRDGLQDRKGQKPNRTDEWWYITNTAQLFTIQNVIIKTKQTEIDFG